MLSYFWGCELFGNVHILQYIKPLLYQRSRESLGISGIPYTCPPAGWHLLFWVLIRGFTFGGPNLRAWGTGPKVPRGRFEAAMLGSGKLSLFNRTCPGGCPGDLGVRMEGVSGSPRSPPTAQGHWKGNDTRVPWNFPFWRNLLVCGEKKNCIGIMFTVVSQASRVSVLSQAGWAPPFRRCLGTPNLLCSHLCLFGSCSLCLESYTQGTGRITSYRPKLKVSMFGEGLSAPPPQTFIFQE